jgi:GNAT superfamily N-acetyltransferase
MQEEERQRTGNEMEQQNEEIRVRAARPADAERLAVLCGQLGYPSSVERVRARLDQVQQDEGNAVLVAEGADGQVIGWVQVYVRPLVVDDLNAEVGGLVVDDRKRSEGVGRLLMEEAEAWARAHGCVAVNVRSNVIRERAHHFYETIGYRRIKTQLTLRKDLTETKEER